MKHTEKKLLSAPARVKQVRDKFICFKALFPKVENLPWIDPNCLKIAGLN